MTANEQLSHVAFTDLIDLAAERLGGRAVAANDEFFAPKENLLKPGRGVFIPDKYTDRGKWMDGWETRRKRVPGHDWCIVSLGLPGVIRGVDVDTNHFLGNFPEACSLDVCTAAADATAAYLTSAGAQWSPLLVKSRLRGGSRNLFAVDHARRASHVRLNIFPDGGVARLRVHGEVVADLAAHAGKGVDVAAAANGGVVLACNDMFFGPKDNLILPGKAINMGDGWETRRRRGAGHDWLVLRLGARVVVERIEVDTHHFKGNFPDTCSIDASDVSDTTLAPPDFLHPHAAVVWREILPRQKLAADASHVFARELTFDAPVSHLRLNIFPDGGISRLRVYGKVTS